MEYEYSYISAATGSIDIEDEGNCIIEAIDGNHLLHYLIIRTNLGITNIFILGPYIKDSNMLFKSVQTSFKRITYKIENIRKAIKQFLNDPFKNLIEARLVDVDTVIKNHIPIIDYIKDPTRW